MFQTTNQICVLVCSSDSFRDLQLRIGSIFNPQTWDLDQCFENLFQVFPQGAKYSWMFIGFPKH